MCCLLMPMDRIKQASSTTFDAPLSTTRRDDNGSLLVVSCALAQFHKSCMVARIFSKQTSSRSFSLDMSRYTSTCTALDASSSTSHLAVYSFGTQTRTQTISSTSLHYQQPLYDPSFFTPSHDLGPNHASLGRRNAIVELGPKRSTSKRSPYTKSQRQRRASNPAPPAPPPSIPRIININAIPRHLVRVPQESPPTRDTLMDPIMFCYEGAQMIGVPLSHGTRAAPRSGHSPILHGASDPIFPPGRHFGGKQISIRLAWPGYDVKEKRLDLRTHSTIGHLWTVVSAGLRELLSSVDSKSNPGDPDWAAWRLSRRRDGTRNFEEEEIIIAGLEHCGGSSFQLEVYVPVAIFLEDAGYRLRPKFQPGYIPHPDSPSYEERATHIRPTIMDATRISDGRLVILKAVSTRVHPHEVEIARLFSSPPLSEDPRNHCVPILDVLQDPDDADIQILVMPRLLSMRQPLYETVGEVVDAFRQIFEVRVV
ncbi:Protein kinase domain-containing protein [Mycena indigotica]|uniref:Protein kinase domain-containing protein n=1 Tax=Mycena indigotica TaxID=2126181 RepID=A0A8H6T8V2_9AGAR|nr:Protein kinase domain-containing protein [Mycena indigotica]KAF7312487.1 Protein kinase domain-containing protein [Mycena indigotica]